MYLQPLLSCPKIQVSKVSFVTPKKIGKSNAYTEVIKMINYINKPEKVNYILNMGGATGTWLRAQRVRC